MDSSGDIQRWLEQIFPEIVGDFDFELVEREGGKEYLHALLKFFPR